ncbi:MAG: hypothetical protein KAT05_00855 [Spirochaetes bacterium]|nr:hypothetical protein [Spirochaetota bacterium]
MVRNCRLLDWKAVSQKKNRQDIGMDALHLIEWCEGILAMYILHSQQIMEYSV